MDLSFHHIRGFACVQLFRGIVGACCWSMASSQRDGEASDCAWLCLMESFRLLRTGFVQYHMCRSRFKIEHTVGSDTGCGVESLCNEKQVAVSSSSCCRQCKEYRLVEIFGPHHEKASCQSLLSSHAEAHLCRKNAILKHALLCTVLCSGLRMKFHGELKTILLSQNQDSSAPWKLIKEQSACRRIRKVQLPVVEGNTERSSQLLLCHQY